VFNNMGTNLLLVSTGRGAGIAVDSKTKQETEDDFSRCRPWGGSERLSLCLRTKRR
jgi:hypothetical protein